MYEGQWIGTSVDNGLKVEQELSDFSWLMVAVTTSLALCLDDSSILRLYIQVYVTILKGNKSDDENDAQGLEQSLRVQLPLNIRSWKSVGTARGIDKCVLAGMKKCLKYLSLDTEATRSTGGPAIPQLNRVEFDDGKVTHMVDG